MVDPLPAGLEDPLLVSMRIRGSTKGHAIFYAFEEPARYAWENLLAGDKVSFSGQIFRKVSKRKGERYRAFDLCFRILSITLLGSGVDATRRDALLLARGFIAPTRRQVG